MLSFWIIAGFLGVAVSAILFRAMTLTDAPMGLDQKDADKALYHAQMAEVERDVARGVMDARDAEQARTEIARRLLAADALERSGPVVGPLGNVLPGVLALAILAGSVALYLSLGAPGYGDLGLANRIADAEELRENRPDQAMAEAVLPPEADDPLIPAEDLALLQQLREAMQSRPDDLRGQQLLSDTEARFGNVRAAARAQKEVLRLKAEPEAKDFARLGELLVFAANGYYVSPEAETALRSAYVLDNTNPTARYYLGLMLVQTGRPDLGFRAWDGLLREGPRDAPWIAPILAQIMPVAQRAGVNYTIPEIGSGRGPTLDDIETANDLTPQARMQMIEGMVSGLSDRLAREGGPPQDWARLITSLAVLGQTEQAAAIFGNATEVFGADPGAMDIINRAGEQAGVGN